MLRLLLNQTFLLPVFTATSNALNPGAETSPLQLTYNSNSATATPCTGSSPTFQRICFCEPTSVRVSCAVLRLIPKKKKEKCHQQSAIRQTTASAMEQVNDPLSMERKPVGKRKVLGVIFKDKKYNVLVIDASITTARGAMNRGGRSCGGALAFVSFLFRR
jgi:hypothetical protein